MQAPLEARRRLRILWSWSNRQYELPSKGAVNLAFVLCKNNMCLSLLSQLSTSFSRQGPSL